MSVLERARLRALALKVESTPGVDAIAGTPAAGDWLDAQLNQTPDVVIVPNPSFTGTLDGRPGIAGGARFVIQGVRVPLRGSGTAGTAPDWLKVLTAAGMVQVDTGTAVGAPTAATAGTGTTATLATPFAATLDLYRFMPVTLSGNPATARTTLITDYTAGRVATLARTFAPVLSTSTLAQIPVNNLLRLTDTDTDWKTLTVYAYQAGQLTIGTYCVVLNPRFELTAGGIGFLVFDLLGVQAVDPADAALPAGAGAVVRPQPPVWRNGECQLGRAVVRAETATLSLGTTGVLAPNAEALNGFDGAHIMSRDPRAQIRVMAESTASAAAMAALRAGTETLFSAIIGSTAGNRIGLILSPAIREGQARSDGNGADMEDVTLVGSAPGRSMGVVVF